MRPFLQVAGRGLCVGGAEVAGGMVTESPAGTDQALLVDRKAFGFYPKSAEHH